jgi:hypothetical protein
VISSFRCQKIRWKCGISPEEIRKIPKQGFGQDKKGIGANSRVIQKETRHVAVCFAARSNDYNLMHISHWQEH